MNHNKLRAVCWLNRFGVLPRVRRAFARTPPGTLVDRELFGLTQVLDIGRSDAQQLLFVEGERFIEERHLLRRLLRPGMTVVDVGANIGYYLLLAKQICGADARVICIEPSQENLPELKETIERNRMRDVIVHEVALGDRDGEIGLRSGINSGVVEGGGEYRVPVRRLDELIEERVDFIKIDVEGFEGQVLLGAVELLKRWRPLLFLELHPLGTGRFGHSCRAILDRLREIYSTIELYHKHPTQGPLDKVLLRYGLRAPVVPVMDADDYVARHDASAAFHTYWAVCRP